MLLYGASTRVEAAVEEVTGRKESLVVVDPKSIFRLVGSKDLNLFVRWSASLTRDTVRREVFFFFLIFLLQ